MPVLRKPLLLFMSFERVDCFEFPRTPSFGDVTVELLLPVFGGIFVFNLNSFLF